MRIEAMRRREGMLYRVWHEGQIVDSWRGPELDEAELAVELERRGLTAGNETDVTAPAICERAIAGLAVAVTCHAPYLRWLPECLASIDGQLGVDRKILALDGCDALGQGQAQPVHWEILRGEWGSPIPGRNAALERAAQGAAPCDWIVYWDADNPMPEGYLEAMREAAAAAPDDVACIFPDLQYIDEAGCPLRLRRVPEVDYWTLRRGNPGVDTSSCWRVDALRAIGGHIAGSGMDDYALALALTRAGWRCVHAPGSVPPMMMRDHDRGRRSAAHIDDPATALEQLWKIRTLGIVTLWAPGRYDVQTRWTAALQQMELPPQTSLYVLDNTGDLDTLDVYDFCLRPNIQRFDVLRYVMGAPDDWAGRHEHIAYLYRQILPRVVDDLVLIWEDDVEPPDGQALRRLHEHFRLNSLVGAAGAAYASPENPEMVCASDQAERWHHACSLSELAGVRQAVPVQMIGGGFTLYQNWALKLAGPIRFDHPFGWDATLSRGLRRAGCRVLLDPRVTARHHIHGAIT